MLRNPDKSRRITSSALPSFPEKAVCKIEGGQTPMDLQNQWANLIIDEADKYARETAADQNAETFGSDLRIDASAER